MLTELHDDTAMSTRSASTMPTAREAFLDLILRDEQLLRAEFDALIAASWNPPPPSPPAPSAPTDRPPGRPVTPYPDVAAWPGRAVPARAAPNRQRSPPSRRDAEGR